MESFDQSLKYLLHKEPAAFIRFGLGDMTIELIELGADDLLSSGPPALWPLVALTSDGAREEVIGRTCAAIEARADLGPSERADHLAVLWFVAEAEDVAVKALRVYLTEEKLMESVLYKEIFEKGRVLGMAQSLRDTIVRALILRLGSLDPAARERIRAETDVETLTVWRDDLLGMQGTEEAQKLVKKIMNGASR
ncbi:MAG: hypothetical protein R3B70_13750 [Polyangiaceae bacterium]